MRPPFLGTETPSTPVVDAPAGDNRAARSAARPANGRLVFARRGDERHVRAYWYDTAAGRRVEVPAGDGEPVYALRDDHADEATARAAAKARLDILKRGSATLGLTLEPGVPAVSAESPLTLSGFRNGVDGLWIAARVSHEIDNSGYSTRVEAGTPTVAGTS